MAVTLNQALKTVRQLLPQQKEMLIEIVRQRQIQAWRDTIVEDAAQAWDDYRAGRLQAQSAEEVIASMHHILNNDDSQQPSSVTC